MYGRFSYLWTTARVSEESPVCCYRLKMNLMTDEKSSGCRFGPTVQRPEDCDEDVCADVIPMILQAVRWSI